VENGNDCVNVSGDFRRGNLSNNALFLNKDPAGALFAANIAALMEASGKDIFYLFLKKKEKEIEIEI